jgi:hypothetical protein
MGFFFHIVKSELLYNNIYFADFIQHSFTAVHFFFVDFIEYSFIARAVIAQSV